MHAYGSWLGNCFIFMSTSWFKFGQNFLKFFEQSNQLNVSIIIMENKVKTCFQIFKPPSNLSFYINNSWVKVSPLTTPQKSNLLKNVSICMDQMEKNVLFSLSIQ
jgi:hypothetical protein